MKCNRCNKWIAWFHVTDRKGSPVASCANCLTESEKTAFDPSRVTAKIQPVDQQAALADKWDKKYAEALAEGATG